MNFHRDFVPCFILNVSDQQFKYFFSTGFNTWVLQNFFQTKNIRKLLWLQTSKHLSIYTEHFSSHFQLSILDNTWLLSDEVAFGNLSKRYKWKGKLRILSRVQKVLHWTALFSYRNTESLLNSLLSRQRNEASPFFLTILTSPTKFRMPDVSNFGENIREQSK